VTGKKEYSQFATSRPQVYGLLCWPAELANLGPAPVNHDRNARAVNVRLFVGRDGGDVFFCSLASFLIGFPVCVWDT
jgi:hypothetical protein